MSVYPIKVVKQSQRHNSGTKDYHLILVTNSNKRSLLITRWGKARQVGQSKVEQFDNIQGLHAFNAKHREKFEKGGYDNPIGNKDLTCHNEGELVKALGLQVWSALGADNILSIDPDADIKGVRDPEEYEFVDDPYTGKKVPVNKNAKPTIPIPEEPEPTVEDQVKKNPDWGMF